MPKPLRLQDRDLDMLHSISTARFLTAQALEWVHYPAWREHYRAHYARLQQGIESDYRPSPNIYRRIAGLEAGGLLQRVVRRSDQASLAYGRLPDIFALTEAGADVLASKRGLAFDELWFETVRQRTLQNLEHSLAIGQVYAALCSACEYRQSAVLDGWKGDHLLAQPAHYDRILVAGYPSPLPVQPDATALLRAASGTTRLFLELDRGTRPLSTWHDKAAAYATYTGHPALRTRYSVDDFVLLIAAPTPQRLKRIAEEIAKVARQPDARYHFLLADHVHPTTIRSYGQRIAQIDWATQKLPHGIVELPIVSLELAALWATPQ